MSYVQTTANRFNPLALSNVQHTAAPYATYGDITLCTDPNCPVCRAQRRDRGHKKHRHRRRHHRHQRRGYRRSFWDGFLPRVESAGTVSVHSVELDDRRGYYNTNVIERAVAPVNRTEQVVTTTAPRRVVDDELVREAWATNPSNDDEVVCCRAYDGCKCPCWCCVILIIIFVILIIVFIVLLATLL